MTISLPEVFSADGPLASGIPGYRLRAQQLEMAERIAAAMAANTAPSVPVLTRIMGAKFKREVRPGDTLEISATLVERLGPAWLLKGKVRVDGKVAVQVEFACAQKGA